MRAMRESLSRPSTCPLSDFYKSPIPVAFLSPFTRFCISEKKLKFWCQFFCSGRPFFHQISWFWESLEAFVIKILSGWERQEMGGRWNGMSGETFVRCNENCPSRAPSREERSERGPNGPLQTCDFEPNAKRSWNVKHKEPQNVNSYHQNKCH